MGLASALGIFRGRETYSIDPKSGTIEVGHPDLLFFLYRYSSTATIELFLLRRLA
jgi:hypothetical protein